MVADMGLEPIYSAYETDGVTRSTNPQLKFGIYPWTRTTMTPLSREHPSRWMRQIQKVVLANQQALCDDSRAFGLRDTNYNCRRDGNVR